MQAAENVLVTGASSGIGAETARFLARRGLRVFGTSRRERAPSPDA
ncbi:MAG: SDR family NAD(P)-dependent oxidoreductase, partial [Myxococcales bacterium]|nr:SDR family NAD(P)-dependent oxidoreductase [Myxococcales bacterium]